MLWEKFSRPFGTRCLFPNPTLERVGYSQLSLREKSVNNDRELAASSWLLSLLSAIARLLSRRK